VSLAKLVRTMHNTCKVRRLNPEKKKKEFKIRIIHLNFMYSVNQK